MERKQIFMYKKLYFYTGNVDHVQSVSYILIKYIELNIYQYELK